MNLRDKNQGMKITVQTFSFGGWRSNEIKAPLRFDGKNLFLLKEIKKIEFLQLTSRKIAKLQFDEIFRESFLQTAFLLPSQSTASS